VKQYRFILTGLIIVGLGTLLSCSIETASGPTPYSVFKGETTSSSSVAAGTGEKNFAIQRSLPLVGTGRTVTISNPAGDLVMRGTIESYDRNSGNLKVTVFEIQGEGSGDDWTVVLGKTYAELQDSIRQAYTDMKFGMFLHFNMSTYDRCCCPECYSVDGEWGLPSTQVDIKQFKASKLDCGQWADVAKSAGMKYMILTSKHHDGFCIWPTKHTEYCVRNAGDTTDIIRAFVDSARARELKVGFYYSIRDYSNGHDVDFIKGQITELLTNYGDIVCLWFDGWGWGPGYNLVPYDTIKNLIKSIQPSCLLAENNHRFNTEFSEIIEYEMPIDGPPKIDNVKPAEGGQVIRASADHCWFWHPIDECTLMPAKDIVDELKMCNSRNATYLLDLTPDTLGLIPQCQVERMREVGDLLGIEQ